MKLSCDELINLRKLFIQFINTYKKVFYYFVKMKFIDGNNQFYKIKIIA
jgi:hypothetical protein